MGASGHGRHSVAQEAKGPNEYLQVHMVIRGTSMAARRETGMIMLQMMQSRIHNASPYVQSGRHHPGGCLSARIDRTWGSFIALA